MPIITLEPGGARPPSPTEQEYIRAAIGADTLLLSAGAPAPTPGTPAAKSVGQWLRKATVNPVVFEWYQWNGLAWVLVRLDNATASAHTHGQLTNDGKVGSTAGLPLKTGAGGVLTTGVFDITAGAFAEGDKLPALTRSAAEGNPNGAYAEGLLEFTADAQDGDQVVIGATTYTFVDDVGANDLPYNVQIAGTEPGTLENLLAAILCSGGEGSIYGTDTEAHATVGAVEVILGLTASLLVRALDVGAASNTTDTTTTVVGAAWEEETLTGGIDASIGVYRGRLCCVGDASPYEWYRWDETVWEAILPPTMLTASKVVADAAARLALTNEEAEGFAVVDADTGKTWMLVEGGDPATSGDWLQLGDRAITSGDVSFAGVAAKTTPVDADTIPLIDSAAGGIWKLLSWTNIKATLKLYFDLLYMAITGLDGVMVTTAQGTRRCFVASADSDAARGLAFEAAYAAAAAATGSVTIDAAPGNYLITKKYTGTLFGGYRVQFPLLDKMTIRLNGARLYKTAVSVAHNALVIGDWYIISGTEGGTADWTSVNAVNNNGGTVFQASATAVSSGTGVVYPATQVMFGVSYVSGVMGGSDVSLLGPGIVEGSAAKSAKANFTMEIGFNTSASRRWRVDGITFIKHQGTGFQANNANFTSDTTGYGVGWKGSTGHVSNCNIDRNNLGVYTGAGNEYITFSNCTFNDNIGALDIYAGNTKFIGCDASANGTTTTSIALRIRRVALGNNEHGCWVGGHITHNIGFAVHQEAGALDAFGNITSTGFIFSGVTFGADSVTTNKIQALGGGLNFVGCYLQTPFFASATPTGKNFVQHCFIGGYPNTADDLTDISDLNAAERAQWVFLDNYNLLGPWPKNDRALLTATLAADQSFQSDTVLRDVTGLTLTLPVGTYKLQGFCMGSPATSTMGVKIALSMVGAGTFSGQMTPYQNTNPLLNSGVYFAGQSVASFLDTRSVAAGANSQPLAYNVEGILVVTASTVVKFQIAQSTSIASDLTAEAGSYLLAERIAP